MKTFFTILISALVGAGVTYFLVCKTGDKALTGHAALFETTSNDTLTNYQEFPPEVVRAVIGRHIIKESKLKELRGNYDAYSRIPGNPHLRVAPDQREGNDDTLRSFFISKILVDTIFRHNPKFNGLRLYLAKHKKDNDGIFTFAIRGVINDKHKKSKEDNAKAADQIGDPIFDYVDTCPTNCK